MPIHENGPLGNLLRQYRQAAGLTQEELAARAGLSTRAISDLERGLKRRPHRDTLRLLVTALSLDASSQEALAETLTTRREAAQERPRRFTSDVPQPLTTLIGRDRQLDQVTALLTESSARLVVLTGPPGVGKTHLALAAAHAARPAFDDGVVFIALDGIKEAAEVLPAIGAALRLVEAEGSPTLETLQLALRECSMLLLLDNCEQVHALAALVGALLRAVPRLKVLATSQVRLAVRGAHEIIVPPLPYPASNPPPALDEVLAAPAVQLFLERVRARDPTFVLNDADAPLVAAICARLDGLPLAIELAAARSAILGLAALLPRLAGRLDILTGGAADLPVRQQTLRNALDWSYGLLSPAEQQLFRRLGVCVGGCTLAAAAALVAAPPGGDVGVLNTITALCERSLLQRHLDAEGELRFTMLDTIRDYAGSRLAAGEKAAAHRLHTRYFLTLAQEGAAGLQEHAPEALTARMWAEQANFRAALAWALVHAPAATGLPLAAALAPWWRVSGLWSEGRYWLETLLARVGEGDDQAVRAAALLGAGELAFYQGDLNQAIEGLALSVMLARHTSSLDVLARALSTLAWAWLAAGAVDAAATLAAEGLDLARRQGGLALQAWALHISGHIARNTGDYTQAKADFTESLALWQSLDHERGLAWALLNLGEVARCQSDFAQAAQHYRDGQARFVALDDQAGISWAERNLGFVALARADHAGAAAHFRRSLQLYEQLSNRRGIAVSLIGQAGALTGSAPEGAARLLGAAHGLLEGLGVHLDAADHQAATQIEAAIRASLDLATYQAAIATGRALPLGTALAQALAPPSPALQPLEK